MNVTDKILEKLNPLDELMHRISSGLPLRLTSESRRATRNGKAQEKEYERIRETFLRHKPAIHIGERLGSGGFSDVFEAHSFYDGATQFAIKILRSDLLKVRNGKKFSPESEEMRIKDIKKRFRNESFIQWHLSQSASPEVAESIVRVFDHGEFDSKNDFRFILMERMGATLRHFINTFGGCQPETYAFKIAVMKRIAWIIRLVHSQGIFHRDIKPENILFPRTQDISSHAISSWRPDQKVMLKLADFGTVRWVRSTNDRFDGEIIGSQFYLSPEQIMNPRHIDPRTDIYSFGVVCYELLYGLHPKQPSVQKMTTRVLQKLAIEPPAPQTPPPGMEALHEIIFKCMKSANERYQSMDDVLRDLEKLG